MGTLAKLFALIVSTPLGKAGFYIFCGAVFIACLGAALELALDIAYVFAQGFGAPSQYVEMVTRGLDELRREARKGHPKMLSLGTHARFMGQPGRVSALREVIEHCQAAGDVWIATREEIARWWIDHHAEWS